MGSPQMQHDKKLLYGLKSEMIDSSVRRSRRASSLHEYRSHLSSAFFPQRCVFSHTKVPHNARGPWGRAARKSTSTFLHVSRKMTSRLNSDSRKSRLLVYSLFIQRRSLDSDQSDLVSKYVPGVDHHCSKIDGTLAQPRKKRGDEQPQRHETETNEKRTPINRRKRPNVANHNVRPHPQPPIRARTR